MARLPQPGGDDGNWGDILNDFLKQAHDDQGRIKPNAVSGASIASGVVDEDKLSPAVRAKLNNTGAGSGAQADPSMGGDLSGTASNAQLKPAVVGTDEMASSSVTNAKLADGAVTESKLDNVLRAKINSASAGVIADNSIQASKLQAGAGSNGQVLVLDSSAPGGFRWQTVSSGSATPIGAAGGALAGTYPNPTLAAGAVSTATLAAGAVTLDKLSSAGATNGQVLTYDGSSVVWKTPSTAPAPTTPEMVTIGIDTTASGNLTLTVGSSPTITKIKASLSGDLTVNFASPRENALFTISLVDTQFNGYAVKVGAESFRYPTELTYGYTNGNWERLA